MWLGRYYSFKGYEVMDEMNRSPDRGERALDKKLESIICHKTSNKQLKHKVQVLLRLILRETKRTAVSRIIIVKTDFYTKCSNLACCNFVFCEPSV